MNDADLTTQARKIVGSRLLSADAELCLGRMSRGELVGGSTAAGLVRRGLAVGAGHVDARYKHGLTTRRGYTCTELGRAVAALLAKPVTEPGPALLKARLQFGGGR